MPGTTMKSLTKKQLIKHLDFADDDDEIYILAQSGDYWRTEVAYPVREVSDGEVTWSEYHRSYKLDLDGHADFDLDHPNKYVILIGS